MVMCLGHGADLHMAQFLPLPRLAVLIQYRRVRDGQIDRQTHDDSIYRAGIASRGDNVRMSGRIDMQTHAGSAVYNIVTLTFDLLYMRISGCRGRAMTRLWAYIY